MAGPLGEMFDHGCDALNTTVRYFSPHLLRATSPTPVCSSRSFFVLAHLILAALGGPLRPKSLPLQTSTSRLGRSTTPVGLHPARVSDTETHTSPVGQLFLGFFSGPVEGILSIVAVYAVTGFVGQFHGAISRFQA